MGFGIKTFTRPFTDAANSVGNFAETLGDSVLGRTKPGDDGSGRAAAEEEARKAALRRRIDILYGIKPGGAADTDPDIAAATAATQGLESEKSKLADATRAYYTDKLAKDYGTSERNLRFAYARSGLLGGSAWVDSLGQLRSERDEGATRVDEAVRRAIGSLEAQRETERLNAIGLVNAGAGDSAVTAAQRGLQNAFNTSSSQQKANLFSDLFAGGADALAANNQAAQQAGMAARYRNQLQTFFPTNSTGSGRITPSA